MIYKKISECRVCNSTHLTEILDLGNQCLTGVFPGVQDIVESGPLVLVKCGSCDLVQLADNYELTKLYGENYGYRSGLNMSMVQHLKELIQKICRIVKLKPDDLVIDIGSNDGTSLGLYERRDLTFLGIDPSGLKFKKYYRPDIQLVPEFFSAKLIQDRIGSQKAKIITSIAMFYDLEHPIDFAKEIAAVLHPEGLWVFEQSYLPAMIEAMAYDTVCHEHLEYYGLKQIRKILAAAELRIVDVDFNDANGGSFCVTASHANSQYNPNSDSIENAIRNEDAKGYSDLKLFEDFAKNVRAHRSKLRETISKLVEAGAQIHAYGASTKGNVILQYCGFSKENIHAVAEVNEDKFGKLTPGTNIPIISEAQSKAMKPTHYLVMPWHFKESILKREKEYILNGGKFIFPLPEIYIVDKNNFHEHLKSE